MIISKIITKKKLILNKLNESINDLIHSTFKFPTVTGSGHIVVNEYEKMRIDTLCNRIYGDPNKWDVMLKYNAISNPFSINTGDHLYVLPFANLDSAYTNPRVLVEPNQTQESDITGISADDNMSNRDSNRLSNLGNKKGEISPNLNREGDTNIKIKDGKVIFGEDVTTVSKKNCATPISRTRLKSALIKNTLFLNGR